MSKQTRDKYPDLKSLDPQRIAQGQIGEWIDGCFTMKQEEGNDLIYPSVALHMVVSQLMKVYPSTTRPNPDGTIWDGILLPGTVLAYEKTTHSDRLDFSHGNLLDMACQYGASDDTIKVLIASGFDPRRFSSSFQMTPIGICACDGNAHTLRLFAQAGFDLSLVMKPEHTRNPHFVGANILHRLLGKNRIDSEEGLKVIEVLLESGVNPLAKDGKGDTPVALSTGNVRLLMERWVAWHQSQALDANTDLPTLEDTRSKPRL